VDQKGFLFSPFWPSKNKLQLNLKFTKIGIVHFLSTNMKKIILRNISSPTNTLRLKVCDTFFSKFRGLMLKKEIPHDGGIMIVEKGESKVNTSIHMMFMNYDITVLWLNKEMVVVDKVLAKRWKLYYGPKEPAQYILEIHSSRFEDFEIGDKFEAIS